MNFDIFISHASEDKDALVRPLAEQLRLRGLRVWFDETELRLGDSLRRSIDFGLSRSRYGLVILSPAFLNKEWPQKELDGLVAREDGTAKVILPIWHNLTRAEIAAYSPPLADKLAASTSKGLPYIVDQVVNAITPSIASANHDALRNNSEQTASRDFQDLIVQLLDRVIEQSEAQTITGVSTGFYDLDLFTSGFQPGSLIVMGARPSAGKTAFALNIAAHIGCNERLPISIFSFGESATQVTNRLVCTAGGIEPAHLRDARLTDDEWPALTEAIERMRHASIHINDVSELSVEDLQSECRRLFELRGALGLVIVDTLQALSSTNEFEDEPRNICRKLKSLAREIRSPILVLSDVPRHVESRADKRPMLSDLGNIEEYADLVLFLYREIMYWGESSVTEVAEVIVAKQKDGSPTGTVRLGFKKRIGKFENMGPVAENIGRA